MFWLLASELLDDRSSGSLMLVVSQPRCKT